MNVEALKLELNGKVCKGKGSCGTLKPMTQFSPNKNTKDKKASRCKQCMVKAVEMSKINKAYREDDEARLRAAMR